MLNGITRYIVIFTISFVWSVSLFGKDYLIVNWESDSAIVTNPYDSVSVVRIGSNISITVTSIDNINVILKGNCEDGSIQVTSPAVVNIVLDNLFLKSENGACIDIQSKKKNEIKIIGDNRLEDGAYRDSILTDDAKGVIYTSGDLTVNGTGNLVLSARYKHGIYADKSLKIKDATIRIVSSPNDGIRGKKDVSISNAFISINDIGKHAINSDKSTLNIKNSRIEIVLDRSDSKGLSCTSDLNCENSVLDFIINGNGSKGIKCNANITLINDSICATAKGNIILSKDDKTYCTVIKGDSCLTAELCFIKITHNGDGGKGISCDKEVVLSNCDINIALNGYGAPYLSNMGEDIDFFTPKCLESKGDLHIQSGRYTFYTSGNGGKGIVCDSLLVIGKRDAPNDSLIIDIHTEGTPVIDDVQNDKRYGCPKAIKCGKDAYIESGIITTKTNGMGGEGFESKGYLTINGGTLVCESFDDGINVEKGIVINGGVIYCTSIDNDGIDSNGFIELNGGVVASLTSHEYDEDFDCDDDTFYLNGGTILGVGRDYSGIYKVQQPYFQHVAVYKDRFNAITDTLEAHTLPKGYYLTLADTDNNPIITVVVHDNIPNMFGTMSSERLEVDKEANVFLTNCPPLRSECLIPDKVWSGGDPLDEKPLLSGLVTTRPYHGSDNIEYKIQLYVGWNLVSPHIFGGIPISSLQKKASELISEGNIYSYDDNMDVFYSPEKLLSVLSYNKAYLVKMEEDIVIEGRGASVPMVLQYSVTPGWNWINYPYYKSLPLSDAFRDKFLSEGDYISDMTDFAVYQNGEWHGTLSDLIPGKGYYFVTDKDKKIQFVY